MINQPAWLREDAQDDHTPAENGGPPSLANLSLHQRNASAGAADFVGMGSTEAPYANGDSHAQPGLALMPCTGPPLHLHHAETRVLLLQGFMPGYSSCKHTYAFGWRMRAGLKKRRLLPWKE